MAEVSNLKDPKLSKPNFHNWIKGQLAVLFTKEELEPVVYEVIETFQKKSLQDIAESNSLPPESTCSNCCTENIVECPTDKICNLGKCRYHRNAETQYRQSGCQNNICHNLKSEIQKAHRFNAPSYKNTDVSKWCSNPWEIAKCFMPPDGYKDVTSAAETDFNGLISIIINHKGFDALIRDDLFERNNIFHQGRAVGKALRHSTHLEVEDADLDRYFSILKNILTDPGFKAISKSQNNALQKLAQLQSTGDRILEVDGQEFQRFVNDILSPSNETQKLEQLDTIPEDASKTVSLRRSEKDQKVIEDRKESMISFVEQDMQFGEDEKVIAKRVINFVAEYVELIPAKKKREKIPMPELQSHDGKLIKLNEIHVQGLKDNTDKSNILKGGFGKVYTPKEVVSGIGVRVALKKIQCKNDENTKILTTYNEKIARRIMHFAVVPLIGYMQMDITSSESVYYFLSPCLGGGSLRSCLKRDFEASNDSEAELKCLTRLKILFQIASAIQYLHTPVEGYRGIVLHMDITSSNIVVDKMKNAKLIDFGLARELNEGQTNVTQSKRLGTPGYFQSQSYSKLTVREDCYNFGVVIREILTGKAPLINNQEKGKPDELRKLGKSTLRRQIQKNIWGFEEANVAADVLNELSVRCLDTDDRNFSSIHILPTFHNEIITEKFQRYEREQCDKCDICMINQVVRPNVGLSPHECPINVCISCMRNSNLNPIICPNCCEKVFPEIGHTFAALLIAGNDLKTPELAKSFTDDVTKIKEVLASKYPCVIGISPENIKIVAPGHPGYSDDDNLQNKISEAFKCLEQKTGITTLVLYYTGHCSPKDGFQLDGANDILTLHQLQKYLQIFCKDGVKRVVAFLDCCYAPDIGNIPDIRTDGVKIIQLNVCKPHKKTYGTTDGTLFRKFFVQALTRKVFNKHCFSMQGTEGGRDCGHCEMAGPFISIGKLLEYISSHIKYIHEDRDPVRYVSDGITYKEDCIGYNIDFAACFEFKFQTRKEDTIDFEIERGIYCDIVELKLAILKKVQDLQGEMRDLPSKDHVDCLSLRIYDGRKDGEELQTMLQISAAMDTGQCVVVSVRKTTQILHGKAAVFLQTGLLYGHLKEHFSIKSRGNTEITYLSKEKLNNVIEKSDTEDNLKELNKDLTEVHSEWDKKENKSFEQLEISFEKKEGGDKYDFVALELHRFKKNDN